MNKSFRETIRNKPEWPSILVASYLSMPLLISLLSQTENKYIYAAPLALLFILFGTLFDKSVKTMFMKVKIYKIYTTTLFSMNIVISILFAIKVIVPQIALFILSLLALYWVYITIATYTNEHENLCI